MTLRALRELIAQYEQADEPDSWKVTLLQGKREQILGKTDEAKKLFDAVINDGPNELVAAAAKARAEIAAAHVWDVMSQVDKRGVEEARREGQFYWSICREKLPVADFAFHPELFFEGREDLYQAELFSSYKLALTSGYINDGGSLEIFSQECAILADIGIERAAMLNELTRLGKLDIEHGPVEFRVIKNAAEYLVLLANFAEEKRLTDQAKDALDGLDRMAQTYPQISEVVGRLPLKVLTKAVRTRLGLDDQGRVLPPPATETTLGIGT